MMKWMTDAAYEIFDKTYHQDGKTLTSLEVSEIIEKHDKASRKDVAMPESLSLHREFTEAWDKWLKFRREKNHGKNLTPSTMEKQLAKLEGWGAEKAIAAINQSIDAGWTGLFEPREGKPTKEAPKALIDEFWKNDASKAVMALKLGGTDWPSYCALVQRAALDAPEGAEQVGSYLESQGISGASKIRLLMHRR
jgi:hypothetical protein